MHGLLGNLITVGELDLRAHASMTVNEAQGWIGAHDRLHIKHFAHRLFGIGERVGSIRGRALSHHTKGHRRNLVRGWLGRAGNQILPERFSDRTGFQAAVTERIIPVCHDLKLIIRTLRHRRRRKRDKTGSQGSKTQHDESPRRFDLRTISAVTTAATFQISFAMTKVRASAYAARSCAPDRQR